MEAPKLTEEAIAKMVADGLLSSRRAELCLNNTYWTGHEADLLVVDHKSLRLIDIEIKLTRTDLKADAKKSKWWHSKPWSKRRPLDKQRWWPPKIWKHYYLMPADVYKPELLDGINPNSGVALLRWRKGFGKTGMEYGWAAKIVRRAKPNRKAEPISAADAIGIARLTSIRYWASR